VRNLFKHAFNLQAGPSLCFIGFSRPTTGAIPACSELVARYFAQILSGNASIPANAAEITREDKAREDAMFCNSLAVRTVVNPTDYMDSLARLIGCYVHPLRWWYNPRQYIRWLSAMSLPCRYRYVGPGANPQVAEEWNARRLTVFTPQRVVMLSLWKALYCLGVFSGDIFVDMRKLGVEVTREAYGRS
jgi:dimethylaniline monooxygenase (N-oxide forming)